MNICVRPKRIISSHFMESGELSKHFIVLLPIRIWSHPLNFASVWDKWLHPPWIALWNSGTLTQEKSTARLTPTQRLMICTFLDRKPKLLLATTTWALRCGTPRPEMPSANSRMHTSIPFLVSDSRMMKTLSSPPPKMTLLKSGTYVNRSSFHRSSMTTSRLGRLRRGSAFLLIASMSSADPRPVQSSTMT